MTQRQRPASLKERVRERRKGERDERERDVTGCE